MSGTVSTRNGNRPVKFVFSRLCCRCSFNDFSHSQYKGVADQTSCDSHFSIRGLLSIAFRFPIPFNFCARIFETVPNTPPPQAFLSLPISLFALWKWRLYLIDIHNGFDSLKIPDTGIYPSRKSSGFCILHLPTCSIYSVTFYTYANLLYGSECNIITSQIIKKLETEIWFHKCEEYYEQNV